LCTTSDHFKVVHIQEHVLSLHDLTMLNSAVSSVLHIKLINQNSASVFPRPI
jgi:hypothetical protein